MNNLLSARISKLVYRPQPSETGLAALGAFDKILLLLRNLYDYMDSENDGKTMLQQIKLRMTHNGKSGFLTLDAAHPEDSRDQVRQKRWTVYYRIGHALEKLDGKIDVALEDISVAKSVSKSVIGMRLERIIGNTGIPSEISPLVYHEESQTDHIDHLSQEIATTVKTFKERSRTDAAHFREEGEAEAAQAGSLREKAQNLIRKDHAATRVVRTAAEAETRQIPEERQPSSAAAAAAPAKSPVAAVPPVQTAQAEPAAQTAETETAAFDLRAQAERLIRSDRRHGIQIARNTISETVAAAGTVSAQAESVKAEVAESVQIETPKVEATEPVQVETAKVKTVEPIQVETVNVEAAEPVQAEAAKIEVAEPVHAETAKVEAAEPVQAEAAKIAAVEPVQVETVKSEAAEPVQVETARIETVEPVQAEAAKIEAAEPVQVETAKIETVEPVQVETVKSEVAEPVQPAVQPDEEVERSVHNFTTRKGNTVKSIITRKGSSVSRINTAVRVETYPRGSMRAVKPIITSNVRFVSAK
ncbi:hypothetical protein [Neisseria sp.]|uniref:hypothetical protein n=1 Tax=Neisseria sp. TaxID=192066 RepID=UPI0035A0FB8C